MIPKSQATNFGEFFRDLDQKLDHFDLLSYGVTMSNLEDVFLKINKEYAPDLFKGSRNNNVLKGNKNDEESDKDEMLFVPAGTSSVLNESASSRGSRTSSIASRSSKVDLDEARDLDGAVDEVHPYKHLIRGSSCTRSCTASAAKRFIIYKRDWCGLICQVIIPSILVLFGLWVTSGPLKLQQSPPKPLSTGFYPYK